ncbi:uncharacterized protein PV09_08148 [Verruconis gallopava]|uniref:F-box domain-containing protein n=1 Tax=Verruconis gallopava TaxID=253628 RepID=A0A0D2A0R7_9PEZI|nr:uncharacterized protein PV09_08148 [Verruconis gallopava]KIW00258.1 hypothetical protein PV09_08148 [Verruconis gallopava]
MHRALRPRLSLLELPVELRLQIYSYSFGYEETALPRWGYGQPSRSVALLRTCRQIYTESRHILYNQTTLLLTGRSLHPLPGTVDKHFGTMGRTWLRNLIIIEPRAIPYRYSFGVFPTRISATDWDFSILRHFPAVRGVEITDTGPIPLRLLLGESCEKMVQAVEQFIRSQLSQTLQAFSVTGGAEKYPEVSIFASTRLWFTCPEVQQDSHDQTDAELVDLDDSNNTTCNWYSIMRSKPLVRESVLRVKLHPVSEDATVNAEDYRLAKRIILRHMRMDSWFPVRSIS